MLSMVGPCIPNVAIVTGMKGEGPRERTARNWKPEGEGQAQTSADTSRVCKLAKNRLAKKSVFYLVIFCGKAFATRDCTIVQC